MLQGHRVGAKQLSPFYCSLRQISSLLEINPSCNPSTKTCYSISTPLPIKDAASQSVSRRAYSNKRNKSWRIPCGLWQEKNWAATQWSSNITSEPIKFSLSAYFSHSTTVYLGQNQGLKPAWGSIYSSDTDNTSSTTTRHTPETRGVDLVERFRRLEDQMNNIRNKENLDTAFQCFGALEKAIGDIVRSEFGATPVSDIESIVEKSEEGIDEATITDAKNPDLMEFPIGVDLINLEDLEFTSEPKLPYVPLTTYQIPEDILQKKQLLKDGNINKAWSHLLYLNNTKKSPRVHYCTSPEEAEKAAALFFNDKVVGFDIEWDPWAKPGGSSPRSYVSLVQIANQSDIALFHLAIFKCDDKQLLPKALRKIILSKDILKVGVNITGDAQRIYKYLKVVPQGLFELSDLQNLLDTVEAGRGTIPRRLISLSTLTSENLLLPLSKGRVRMSQWKKPLTDKQIEYAASDAYAGLRIFDALEERRNELRPLPPLPPCRKMVKVTQKTTLTAKRTKRVLKESVSIKSSRGDVDGATEAEIALDTEKNPTKLKSLKGIEMSSWRRIRKKTL